MDPIKDDHDMGRVREVATNHLRQPKFSVETSIYEDRSVYPRIGDEYQVQLPPLQMEIDDLLTPQRSIVGVPEVEYSDKIGLPIPVLWIPTDDNSTREKLQGNLYDNEDNELILADLEKIRKDQNSDSHADELHVTTIEQNAEVLNETSDGKPCTGLRSLDSALSNDHMDMKSQNTQQRKAKCYAGVPGSQSSTWGDSEAQNFLLGLYIFGKNLLHVRNFIESKKMGDVLAFYYGAFYKSSAHCRWSERRKSKNKRCVDGQRIFSGWRQHELLSRLLPRISPDKQNTLLQVTKTFNEGECSLKDYVAAVKGTVGVQALVEAVGIGKGKQDLTSITLDHGKGNQALSVHSEIPSGKACSALTSGEIIKFLTGNFRLSKTRSSDLFWEAVWPRLLAKGWHSEQPDDQIGTAAKNNLVFLIPGVKKFSRSELVKGEHYFDCISDVLNKVTSDPMLLVEVKEDKVNSKMKEEDACAEDVMDQNGPTNEKIPCYLRPRFPDYTSGLMKFTVVDTSLVQGEEPFKIREVRSFPPDATTYNHIPLSSSDGTEVNSSSDHLESGDASLPEQEESDLCTSDNKSMRNDLKHTVDHKMQSDHPPIPKRKRIHKQDVNGQGANTLNEEAAKNTKNQFRDKEKSPKLNYLSPVRKKHKPIACDFSEASSCAQSFPRGHQMNKEMSYELKSPDAIDTMVVKLATDNKIGKDSYPGKYTESVCHDPSFPRQCCRKKKKSLQVRSLSAFDTVNVKLGTDNDGKGSFEGKTFTRFPGEGGPPSKSSPYESDNSVGCSSVGVMVSTIENSQQRAIIDLNVPQFPQEFDAAIPFSAETAGSQDSMHINETSQSETSQYQDDYQPTLETSNMAPCNGHTGINERRQSTRSRPPTTKALEALASGYFNVKCRGRCSKTPSRSSRSVRKNAGAALSIVSIGDGNVTSKITDSRTLQGNEKGNFNENGRNFFSRSSAEAQNKHLTCDLLHIS